MPEIGERLKEKGPLQKFLENKPVEKILLGGRKGIGVFPSAAIGAAVGYLLGGPGVFVAAGAIAGAAGGAAVELRTK